MYCSRVHARPRLLLLVISAIFGSCSRHEPPSVPRLAILRFENLTDDDSLNWMGRAVSEVMAAELAGSRTLSVIPFSTLHAANRALGSRPLMAPGISTEETAASLGGATQIIYGRISRESGKLRLDAGLYETQRQKTGRTLMASGAPSQGVIALADSLAKQLATAVRPFETQNPQALREYCAGLESPDGSSASQAFGRAVRTDPNFGLAYVALAQLAVAQNNPGEAERVLAMASARGAAISELERARLDAIGARLHGDFAAGVRALDTIGRLNPADLGLFRQLALGNLTARQYAGAIENLRKAIALEPQDAALLNQLGYAEMYAGNLPEATKALNDYARLKPDDPNALDSIGEANFYLGQFAAAEKFFRQSYDKDPHFADGIELTKAAYARLMTGDIRGADAVFNQYLETRRQDPMADFRRAEWEFASGRRRQAVTRMETFVRSLPAALAAIAPQLYAQLTVWTLELGDQARARAFGVKASQGAVSAPALIARLLIEPAAPASEWTARAAQLLPGSDKERLRKIVLAYALVMHKEFQAAEPILSDLYQHSAPEPQEILPVLLAWTKVQTGHFEQAAPLVEHNPIPSTTGDIFTSLAYPRLFYLRGAVLEKQGRRDEAAKNYRLFLTLSGPDAQVFGEETRARQALGQ